MNILIVHPDLRKIGGAELVCLHIVGCLLRETDATITVHTLFETDFSNSLQSLGYDAESTRLHVRVAHLPAFVPKEGPQAMARLAWLHRSARKLATSFDVGISTYNEIHLGIPTLQYIHHPFYVGVDELDRHRLAAEQVVMAKRRWLHRAYDAANRLIAGASRTRFQRNLSLTNSAYMADIIHDCYGIRPVVLYPSFVNPPVEIPTAHGRESRILIAGRFAPDKEILPFLESASIHSSVPVDVAGLSVDAAYTQRIHDIASRSDGRILVFTDITTDELQYLMLRNRYFVNTRRFEHFGIATLEAAAAGCIPFVHASGGSPEIVPFPELQYNDASDVFDRIRTFDDDPSTADELSERVARHLSGFEIRKFHEGFLTAFHSFSDR